MPKFTNPLETIKIAAPCGANWNEMRGDERRRYCSACQLNVYNLSDMTQREAEKFLINSEGRVCLKILRRSDGTIITRNCPVGLEKLKKRVSRTATAFFALIAGFFGGTAASVALKSLHSPMDYNKVSEPVIQSQKNGVTFSISDGILENLPEIKTNILRNRQLF